MTKTDPLRPPVLIVEGDENYHPVEKEDTVKVETKVEKPATKVEKAETKAAE